MYKPLMLFEFVVAQVTVHHSFYICALEKAPEIDKYSLNKFIPSYNEGRQWLFFKKILFMYL